VVERQVGGKEFTLYWAAPAFASPLEFDAGYRFVEFRSQFDERSPLDEVVQHGAQKMLQAAIESEVEYFIQEHSGKVDENGRRLVVRNGRLPAREVMTGAGMLQVEQPRVRDNDPEQSKRVRFSPSLIPQYMRRSPSMEEMIPVVYLLGVSTGDYQGVGWEGG